MKKSFLNYLSELTQRPDAKQALDYVAYCFCNNYCRLVAEKEFKMDNVERIIEEFEIEKLMRGNGVARFHKNVDKAVEKIQRYLWVKVQAGKNKGILE